MKKILKAIFFVTIVGMTLTGCNKKEVCKSYALDDKEISWTDYNTVGEVNAYFECYKETVRMHLGDTMKVVGYLVPGSLGITGPFNYESILSGNGYVDLRMGDYYEIPCNKQGLVFLRGNLNENNPDYVSDLSMFQDYQWGQKIYATVIILWRSINSEYCCDYLVCRPIEIEIENMGDRK